MTSKIFPFDIKNDIPMDLETQRQIYEEQIRELKDALELQTSLLRRALEELEMHDRNNAKEDDDE